MSLLTICEALAKNVGLAVPNQIVNGAREWVEAREFASEAGQELARRVDWSALSGTSILTGTGGASFAHPLPSDFDRMQRGITVMFGTEIVRPLTRPEWNTVASSADVGSPRYFLIEDGSIYLWPALEAAASATVYYQSKDWVNDSLGETVGDEYTADDDVAVLDEDLLTMALIVRWRRQKGMDYSDYEAEYEAALQDRARFDRRSRF